MYVFHKFGIGQKVQMLPQVNDITPFRFCGLSGVVVSTKSSTFNVHVEGSQRSYENIIFC